MASGQTVCKWLWQSSSTAEKCTSTDLITGKHKRKRSHLLDRTSRSIVNCVVSEAFSALASDSPLTSVLLVFSRSLILHTCRHYVSVIRQDT